MQSRYPVTLLAAMLALASFASRAESDSAWLPIPGQLSLSANQTYQSGKNAYIGATRLPVSAITMGAASKYRRSATELRVDYGISDEFALDAKIGYGEVKAGAADNDKAMTDSVIGIRWRAIDEVDSPSAPTVTFRAAAILKGDYRGDRLAALGKAASGVELAAIVGKNLTPNLAVSGEVGFQNLDHSIPNAKFFEIGARYRIAPGWSASAGYSYKRFGGDLDIGGAGFTPAKFQQVREEREVVKFGVGYAFAANQGIGLTLSRAVKGRNTVKDDEAVSLGYTYSF